MYIRGRYGHGGRPGMEKEWRCVPELSGGGELIDQGPHLIDLSRWFLGDLRLDYGIAPTTSGISPSTTIASWRLRGGSGQMAWLHATWTEWKNMFSFEIFGRDGKLVIDGLGGSYGAGTTDVLPHAAADGAARNDHLGIPVPDQSWERNSPISPRAISEGRRPCGDIEDAYANLKIVDQVYAESVVP